LQGVLWCDGQGGQDGEQKHLHLGNRQQG
jgi:hypothetical protein